MTYCNMLFLFIQFHWSYDLSIFLTDDCPPCPTPQPRSFLNLGWYLFINWCVDSPLTTLFGFRNTLFLPLSCSIINLFLPTLPKTTLPSINASHSWHTSLKLLPICHLCPHSGQTLKVPPPFNSQLSFHPHVLNTLYIIVIWLFAKHLGLLFIMNLFTYSTSTHWLPTMYIT